MSGRTSGPASHPSDDRWSLRTVCDRLGELAPLSLAESWDNVGLLVGDADASVGRVMTCLTITPGVAEEAVDRGCDLLIAHHPLPFKPLAKLTSESTTGRLLLRLIRGGVAVYSAHTAFDSAADGINQQWAQMLRLEDIGPLVEGGQDGPGPAAGSGRWGILANPQPLDALVCHAARLVGATTARRVGPGDRPVRKVGVACGSGGSFVAAARDRGCDVLLTGEATLHTCLEAESRGLALGLLGHHASEHFAMRRLAARLADRLPGLECLESQADRDPVSVVVAKASGD